MALADSVGAVCAFLGLPAGATTATTTSTTHFLRAVRDGRVTATARPLHRGRTQVVVKTDLTDSGGPARRDRHPEPGGAHRVSSRPGERCVADVKALRREAGCSARYACRGRHLLRVSREVRLARLRCPPFRPGGWGGGGGFVAHRVMGEGAGVHPASSYPPQFARPPPRSTRRPAPQAARRAPSAARSTGGAAHRAPRAAGRARRSAAAPAPRAGRAPARRSARPAPAATGSRRRCRPRHVQRRERPGDRDQPVRRRQRRAPSRPRA